MAIPLIIVIASGLLLQVKKQFAWIQPPTQRGTGSVLTIAWNDIIETAKQNPAAGVRSWDDIDRLDVRPAKGIVKVRCHSGWELQLDTATGHLLSAQVRRSDWIESIHDGSFFSESAKLWLFLPNGLVLLLLWCNGCLFVVHPRGCTTKKEIEN